MNKTVIITGGARGIGKSIVYALAKRGYNIVLNYNKSEKEAKEIKSKLENEKAEICIFKADVSKHDEARKLVEFAKDNFGKIDILINNAGIDQEKLFTYITDEEWDNMIKTNLNSAFYMSQEVVKDMLERKDGCIINISSIWGIVGASCEVHYSVSKAGMDGLTKSLAKELAPSNIRVNSVAPGAIMTDMNARLSEDEIKQVESEIPLGRFGRPDEIAKCVCWLIEDEYTTGQIISPNGGWVI